MAHDVLIVSLSETDIKFSQNIASFLSLDKNIKNNMQPLKFSDKEFNPYFKDESGHEVTLEGKTVVVTYNASAFKSPQDLSFRAFQTIRTAKRYGSKEIIFVASQLPYARADREIDRKGNHSELFADLLYVAGEGRLQKVITLDVHNPAIASYYTKHGIEFENISTEKIFADYFMKYSSIDTTNLGIVSPDQGALQRTKNFAALFPGNIPIMKLQKWREKANSSEHTKIGAPEMIQGDTISGRDVIIYDDIIDTAGTTEKVVSYLMSENPYGAPKHIFIAFTHPVLGGEAHEMIQNKLTDIPYVKEFVTTNSRPYLKENMKSKFAMKTSLLLVEQLLANAIKSTVTNTDIVHDYSLFRYDNHFKNQ